MNLRRTTTTTNHPDNSTKNLPTSTPKSPQKTPLSPNSKSPYGRVFTQEDEIKLLKIFKKKIFKNPNATRSSISFGQFTHTQISSKLKRLKEKYHKMAKTKSKIKTHHDRKIYSIARKIWGKNVQKMSAFSINDENGGNLKEPVVLEDGLDYNNENAENGDNLKVFEDGLDYKNRNAGNLKERNGGDLESREDEVDLEKFPFLIEGIPEEVKRMGPFYFEGLKRLGEEKLKELDEKWMVLSMLKAEIETDKSLLFQKQFILVAGARQKM